MFLLRWSIVACVCKSARCRDACLSDSENSCDVVAPVVMSVAAELLDPDFFSCEEFLLLRLLLLLLLLLCWSVVLLLRAAAARAVV